MLYVLCGLKRIARLVGREVRDENDWLALALNLVVDIYAVRLHDWHPRPSFPTAAAATRLLPESIVPYQEASGQQHRTTPIGRLLSRTVTTAKAEKKVDSLSE
jgi:hypothetical protein